MLEATVYPEESHKNKVRKAFRSFNGERSLREAGGFLFIEL